MTATQSSNKKKTKEQGQQHIAITNKNKTKEQRQQHRARTKRKRRNKDSNTEQ